MHICKKKILKLKLVLMSREILVRLEHIFSQSLKTLAIQVCASTPAPPDACFDNSPI